MFTLSTAEDVQKLTSKNIGWIIKQWKRKKLKPFSLLDQDFYEPKFLHPAGGSGVPCLLPFSGMDPLFSAFRRAST